MAFSVRLTSVQRSERLPKALAKMASDYGLGALLGAAVGDAVGAFLEFRPSSTINKEAVDTALTLPGGGAFSVGPGQFTDDTELALCQAHGLAGHAPRAGFPANSVAQQYAWWCNDSHPFDMGITTATAFRLRDYMKTTDFAAALHANVRSPGNQASKSNGATMRATPLAIWAHRLSTEGIAACAAADAQLSHPNRACQDANAAYVIAVASLIRSPGDAAAALAAAESWAAAHACEEVQEWLQTAHDDSHMAAYDATPNMGFVKHAIQLAFYHLRCRSGFVEGLRHTLLACGDTDTNAAIVGGVLGALHGASGIPEALRSQVQTYRFDGTQQYGDRCVRPARLLGAQLAPLATRLYRDALQVAGQA